MGLTSASTGKKALDQGPGIQRRPGERVIALAGNPNVGKSSVFNALTKMRQHTGNWAGKTVTNAQGRCRHHGIGYLLVDLPGTYSLLAHSAEEAVARDFICFGEPDALVVVCDATCLERNLILALQGMELTSRVVICVNLMDEAEKKGIRIQAELLEQELGVPVVLVSARKGKGLEQLMDQVERVCQQPSGNIPLRYPKAVEERLEELIPYLTQAEGFTGLPARWLAMKLLCGDQLLVESLQREKGVFLLGQPGVLEKLGTIKAELEREEISQEKIGDLVSASAVLRAEEVCGESVQGGSAIGVQKDRRWDQWLTSRWAGGLVMIALLALIFWITITGANIPSQWLSSLFEGLQWEASEALIALHAPVWLRGLLVDGILKVLGWVVSVMLPPMAIFFPLFTLLEDIGYLPRVAFTLDHCFKKCGTCGKQALTIAMGFGCNAAAVTGARIIDSPRERLIAILTNSFVPCNGRLPMLISMITMFFLGSWTGTFSTLWAALMLTALILLGLGLTFLCSALLSKTVLKGIPSAFTLELPPYRTPQVGQIIVRSVFDRTLFVLGRAAMVAAPAGLVIWVLANVQAGGQSLLLWCTQFLDPLGRLVGMDGVILMAFLLGFPANEIVVPLILMCYLSTGNLVELENLEQLRALLTSHGWNWVTALCVMLFGLFHWPCSTTCLTIRKETGSWKWTLGAVFLPTVLGFVLCGLVAAVGRSLGVG